MNILKILKSSVTCQRFQRLLMDAPEPFDSMQYVTVCSKSVKSFWVESTPLYTFFNLIKHFTLTYTLLLGTHPWRLDWTRLEVQENPLTVQLTVEWSCFSFEDDNALSSLFFMMIFNEMSATDVLKHVLI